MLVAAALILIVLAFALPLFVQRRHVKPEEPVSPTLHLEDRKAAIYENLRDLQAEFQMGKMSEADYAASKRELQRELAGVLAKIEQAENNAR